ncbi:MAG: hypothetical protein ACXVB1_06795, partial [Pseudobdellovibrionaceae bacterium]
APSSYLSVLFKKSRFDRWPAGLKWGLEALVVISVIVTFLTVAPWEKIIKLRLSLGTNDVVLAELNKPIQAKKDLQAPSETPSGAETPQFIDEDIKATNKGSVVASSGAMADPSAKAVLKHSPESKIQGKTAAKVAQAGEKDEPEEEISDNGKISGYLYRGQIAVTNLEAVGPKIKEKIMELGGRKAGEVELGWQKTPESAYFHFTIPEAKYDELQAFLSEYGKAKISKDKHPRVMPDGIIRLIITVDEAKKK